jgi:hypothetical protein
LTPLNPWPRGPQVAIEADLTKSFETYTTAKNEIARVGNISGVLAVGVKKRTKKVRKTPSWPRSWANFSL